MHSLIDMPICDGVEAAKRLRHLESKRKASIQLPSMVIMQNVDIVINIFAVIALSADCQESTKQLCLSAGMNAFFTKPLKKGKPWVSLCLPDVHEQFR